MNASTIIGYGVATVSAGMGTAVLLGLLLPEYAPWQLRITVGIVFILLGIYRLSMTRFKEIQRRREL